MLKPQASPAPAASRRQQPRLLRQAARRASGAATPPPAHPRENRPPGQQRQQPQQPRQPQQQPGEGWPVHHRRALLAAAAAAATAAAPRPVAAEGETTLAQAAAGSFTAWWRSRRTANGGAKLLAPLYVAQQRLQQAADLLRDGSSATPDDVLAALQMVRSSSLNCYLFEALPGDSLETKASLITQKLELSDPCTFRIVLKNATDLEPPATQEAARDKMEALVLSFQKLDAYLDMAREGNTDAIPKAQEQLRATQVIAADIEAFVKATLGV